MNWMMRKITLSCLKPKRICPWTCSGNLVSTVVDCDLVEFCKCMAAKLNITLPVNPDPFSPSPGATTACHFASMCSREEMILISHHVHICGHSISLTIAGERSLWLFQWEKQRAPVFCDFLFPHLQKKRMWCLDKKLIPNCVASSASPQHTMFSAPQVQVPKP